MSFPFSFVPELLMFLIGDYKALNKNAMPSVRVNINSLFLPPASFLNSQNDKQLFSFCLVVWVKGIEKARDVLRS